MIALQFSVVPATVGGNVIQAIDVLSDDIPRVLQSSAAVAPPRFGRPSLMQNAALWSSTLLKPAMEAMLDDTTNDNATLKEAFETALRGREKPLLTLWEQSFPQQCYPTDDSLDNTTEAFDLSNCRTPSIMLSFSTPINDISWFLKPMLLLRRGVSPSTRQPFIEVWEGDMGVTIVNQSLWSTTKGGVFLTELESRRLFALICMEGQVNTGD